MRSQRLSVELFTQGQAESKGYQKSGQDVGDVCRYAAVVSVGINDNGNICDSVTAANIMFVATVVFLVSIVVHHVLCGVVEWGYIRLGRTDEARTVMLELQKKTIVTMAVGYAGWLTFLITLFVMIVRGKTGLPAWGCVFNTALITLLITPTKIPAKGNVAGALMFIGLLFLI